MDKKPGAIIKNPQLAERGRRIKFSKSYDGNRCLLSVTGELKHGEAHVLYDEVVGIFESDITDILIDLRNVTYSDTVGLQNLVKIYKYVKDREDLKFTVLAPEEELWEILVSCRFDKFMTITRDEDIVEGNWRSY